MTEPLNELPSVVDLTESVGSKRQRQKIHNKYLGIIGSMPHSKDQGPAFCEPIGAVCLVMLEKLGALTDATKTCCINLIHGLMQNNLYVEFLGHNRIAMAAALVFLTYILCKCPRTNRTISRMSSISMDAIRFTSRMLMKTLRIQWEGDGLIMEMKL